MNRLHRSACTIFVIGAFAAATAIALPAAAQNAGSDTTSGAELVITPRVNGTRKPPVLQQNQVTVLVKKHPAQITRWEPGSNAELQLVFLIDNSAPSYVSLQFSSIKTFIQGLPPSTEVGIAYMSNGMAEMAQTLTANHQLAANSLRLPNTIPGISGSPYFCLSDLAKHWPSHAQARRVVLMITNGEDPYYRSADLQDPYVAAAISDSQKAGLLVYSIYFRDRGARSGHMQTLFGQSYLQMVSDQTGGQTFQGSMLTPVSFDPYLAEFRNVLQNQYMVSIAAQGKGLQPVKVQSRVPGLKLSAPSAVMVGALQ